MYDIFMSAGRDWGSIVDGRPGPQLMVPTVVSARPIGDASAGCGGR